LTGSNKDKSSLPCRLITFGEEAESVGFSPWVKKPKVLLASTLGQEADGAGFSPKVKKPTAKGK
jgi:hypothetical protein